MMIQKKLIAAVARHRQTLLFILSVLITSYVLVTLPLLFTGQLKLESITSSSHVHLEMHSIRSKQSQLTASNADRDDSLAVNPKKRLAEYFDVTDSDLEFLSNNDSKGVTEANIDTLLGKRQDHFVYVKIEKTGSSTLSNIFSSYGYRHGLNMMMSHDSRGLLNSSEMTPGVSWDIGPDREHPHIMEQHARYNQKFYEKFFPRNTVYITSIRDPVKWFISFVDFMSIYRLYSPRDVLNENKLFYQVRPNSPIQMQMFAHNNFLQFLGFDVYKSNNLTAIQAYIDFIDRRFKLVMLTDYFDESLVLLKRLMNWSMADIFYKYANEAQTRSGTVFTEKEKEKLQDEKHNLGDWLLYQHFNRTFWEKVAKERKFFEEVEIFRRLKRKVQEFCFSDELMSDRTVKMQISTFQEKRIEFGERDCLAIRVRDGEALEFSAALDAYCPFRGTINKVEKQKMNVKRKGGRLNSFADDVEGLGIEKRVDLQRHQIPGMRNSRLHNRRPRLNLPNNRLAMEGRMRGRNGFMKRRN